MEIDNFGIYPFWLIQNLSQTAPRFMT